MKMKRILTVLMFLLVLLPGREMKAQYNHKHYILMGKIDLSNEKYSDAIQNFNIAILAKPNDFEGYFLRGIAKYSLSDFSGAVDDFTRTIELHPLYVRAYHYRGVANDQLSNYAAAMDDFRRAIGMDPYDEELHLASGSTRMHLNDYEGAIAEFDTALIINPENSNALISRGVAKRYIDDLDGAINDLNLAVYNDFFNIEAVIRRGMLEIEAEDYQSAMDDFNNAIKLDKNNPLIYFNRAAAFLNLGDTAAALRDYEKVNNLDQRNALTYFNRAIIYTMIGEYDVALALYDKAIEINPQNIYTYFNRGILFCNLEDWDAAEDDFSTVIDLFPDFIDAWVNRAAVRYEKNDTRGAEMDRWHAREIMALVNDNESNIDSLYQNYANKDYNKIIRFESDFVNGDRQNSLTQFSDIVIRPCKSLIVNLTDKNASRYDAVMSQVSEMAGLDGRMAYVINDLQEESHESLLNDSIISKVTDGKVREFLDGLNNFEMFNYQRSEVIFRSLLGHPLLGVYAGINLAAVQYAKAELVLVDRSYDNSVYITQKKSHDKTFAEQNATPDYSIAVSTLETLLQDNKKNPYLWYNLGNVHLQMKQFQRAIDDFTMAIKYDSHLGEAYYNRALTLLYLRKNELAIKDLSKAGELGITDAYVVMKRFSGNK